MAKNSTTSSSSASTSASTRTTNGDTALGVKARKLRKSTMKAKKPTRLNKLCPKIEALKPKKPPTAFFFFMEDFRRKYQEQNPDVRSMRDIGKACGDKWKTMTYEEKVPYYDIATEKRAEFDIAMADFVKRKENGEFDALDSEYEEDSESDG